YQALCARGVSFSFGAPVDYIGGPLPTVVSTNARAAAALVAPHAPTLGAALGRVRLSGLETVTAFFEPRPDDIAGFGVLFPRGCGIDALGVLFNTSIFPGRGIQRSETWIYSLAEGASAAPAADRVSADREVLTGRRQVPLGLFATTRPDALPVYDAGIVAVKAHVAELPPWLALSGNYLGQIGVSTLLARAEATAASLIARASGRG